MEMCLVLAAIYFVFYFGVACCSRRLNLNQAAACGGERACVVSRGDRCDVHDGQPKR